MTRTSHRGWGARLLWLVPLVPTLILFYLPLSVILAEALKGGEGPSPFVRLFSSPYTFRVIGFTLWQALVSTVVSLILGLPGAWLLGRVSFRGKRLLKALTAIPFVLPSILVVLAFVIFYGNSGVLNRFVMGAFDLKRPPFTILYSFSAIILAHAFYNFPLAARLIGSFWERHNDGPALAARTLGAGPFRTFFTVTLPGLLPAIFSAAGLIYLFCFMSFAVVLVLGGGPRYTTIEVEIYRAARISLDLDMAAALAVVGAALTLVLLFLTVKMQHRASHAVRGQAARRGTTRLSGPVRFVWGLYILMVVLVVASPLLALVGRSFLARTTRSGPLVWTLKWYAMLFTETGPSLSLAAVKNSLTFAMLTVCGALPLGLAAAWVTTRSKGALGRLTETAMMLPMGVSSVVLGLGYFKCLALFFPDYSGSRAAVVAAHVVVTYPFVLRAVSASLKRISPSLPQAARTLGAGPFRTFFTVELPLIRSGLVGGACFAFALSMGEINATLILAQADTVTIPLALYRLIGAYRYFAACALGALLMGLCVACFLLLEWMGGESLDPERD
ncbi:ABC transporter permease [Desulfoluna spongiiphila]|uniref:Thiamine transport system permease protein n=1 Tax=Desulfoluna spongiiphila TaxID=419481 RepID=A0A1G5ATQ0_9BACT|nr:iron ABC transporter permease [Desulfoluna spongiiphila]SCX81209.1 thiamine transport system permease protein [Desulfoluna spongiiphila]VVS92001.1 abc transporter type 1 transmembrane domain meti-like [Desulfoluna spongiiphila]